MLSTAAEPVIAPAGRNTAGDAACEWRAARCAAARPDICWHTCCVCLQGDKPSLARSLACIACLLASVAVEVPSNHQRCLAPAHAWLSRAVWSAAQRKLSSTACAGGQLAGPASGGQPAAAGCCAPAELCVRLCGQPRAGQLCSSQCHAGRAGITAGHHGAARHCRRALVHACRLAVLHHRVGRLCCDARPLRGTMLWQ